MYSGETVTFYAGQHVSDQLPDQLRFVRIVTTLSTRNLS